MPADTITLALEGEVYLSDFAKAIDGLQHLVSALGAEVAKATKIEWAIDSLERSSAIATLRGVSNAPDAVERVVDAYLRVGRSQEQGSPIPFGEAVRDAAGTITGVLDGRVHSVRLETYEGEAVIQSAGAKAAGPSILISFGAVTGRVQTLSNRGGLRFTLYDLVYDKAISCYLTQSQEETMLGLWGRLALVEGRITRDRASGRALAVRQVAKVVPKAEVEPGSYRLAAGAVPAAPAADAPETIIRRLRDA